MDTSTQTPNVPNEQTAVEPVAPTTISIGGEEYTPEEAQALIGLGKIGREAEEKYQTKLDRVWPEYTKSRQEIKDLSDKLSAKEQTALQTKVDDGVKLSEEEQLALVKAEARRLGLPLSEDIPGMIASYMAGQQLLTSTEAVAKEWTEKGIKTDAATLLEFMQENGVQDPIKAFKLKYEDQYDAWKEKQLEKARPKGLVTQTESTAGSKQPVVEPVTRQNLRAMVAARLEGESAD